MMAWCSIHGAVAACDKPPNVVRRLISQIDGEDSSELALPQKAMITLSVAGSFVDDGTVDGAADNGDHMEYGFTVENSGSTTLTGIGTCHI